MLRGRSLQTLLALFTRALKMGPLCGHVEFKFLVNENLPP